MDLNPQRVRSAEFKTAKRGLDPEEVRRFLGEVADALETAQNQSTAMEARARAAVARLQELSDDASSQASAARSEEVVSASTEQAETISRTLLLAQRTADTAIAEAEAESQRLVAAATEEASSTLDSTREMAAHLMEEAREEARRLGESERLAVASEVDSLMARRDFLESDVDQLEQFLHAQRERLRFAAGAMIELTERVDAGLGEVRPPLLSAADNEGPDGDQTATAPQAAADDTAWTDTPTPDDTAPDLVSDASAPEHAADELLVEAAAPTDVDATPAGTLSDVDEIEEYALEDALPVDDTEPPQAAFDLDDVTGEHDRPPADEDVRFSFDDRG